jgi:catechol 2,3-dioxygenase-like lactoylglutathione lyase family enzyme
MLDHITLRVRDGAASKAFYAAALKPLGYGIVMEFGGSYGMGVGGKPDFWITPDPEARPQHVAFRATSREMVDAFYAAAMAAGGRDNGPPGLRLDYHPNYYGAFVLDPSGHNVEAVCHAPPAATGRAPTRMAARTPARKAARREARKPDRKPARKARR